MDKLSKIDRRLLGFTILIFLLVALPILIYLVRTQQIFKPKAVGENSSLNFIAGPGGNVITQRNSSEGPNTWLKLIWASGGTNPSPSPSASPGTIAPNCQLLNQKINASFGLECGDNGYDKIADVNKSGAVTILDQSLVTANNQNNDMCRQWLSDQTDPCSGTTSPPPSATPSIPPTQTACSTGNEPGVKHTCTICGPNNNLVQGQIYQYTVSPTFDCSGSSAPVSDYVINRCPPWTGKLLPSNTSTAVNGLEFMANRAGQNEILFSHDFLGPSEEESCKLNVVVSSSKLPSAQCTKAAADIDGDGVVTSGFCSDRPASDTTLVSSCSLFSFQAGYSFASPPTGMSSTLIAACKELDLNNNGYIEGYESDCVTDEVESVYSWSVTNGCIVTPK